MASQSQRKNKMKSSQSSQLDSSSVNIQKLVTDTIHYLLIMDQSKIPVKRTDINKNVLKENSKYFGTVMEEVKTHLHKIFGINLTELTEKKGTYLLINDIGIDDENPHITWSNDKNSKTGLLFYVLCLIFMSGNVVTEDVLWFTLKKLGIDVNSGRPHSELGDVKKLITGEFVKQLYIEWNRIEGSDPSKYELKWGPRAHLELSRRDILDFVCHVYGDVNMEQWKSQYRDVLETEGKD